MSNEHCPSINYMYTKKDRWTPSPQNLTLSNWRMSHSKLLTLKAPTQQAQVVEDSFRVDLLVSEEIILTY